MRTTPALTVARPPPTTGYRFTADGRGIEEFAYGFRGGIEHQSSRDERRWSRHHQRRDRCGSSSQRKTLFTNFEFNFTERTTAYPADQLREDRGRSTRTATPPAQPACASTPRAFAAVAGGTAKAGQTISFGTGTIAHRCLCAAHSAVQPARHPAHGARPAVEQRAISGPSSVPAAPALPALLRCLRPHHFVAHRYLITAGTTDASLGTVTPNFNFGPQRGAGQRAMDRA